MRFKSIILAFNLTAVAAASHAQLLTPAKPAAAASAAASAAAPAAAAPASQTSTTTVPAQADSLAPGVITLSDVAKQSGAQAANAPAAAQPAPVPAITVVDGTGQPIDLARDKMRPSAGALLTPNTSPFRLVRITRVGADDTAVIWVKGQHRNVTTGSRVLQYTVGEIKEDGVCLYPAKGKVKDKCRTLLTFQGM